MSELGQETRDFLASARRAHDAPPEAKERVRAGLVLSLGAPADVGGRSGTVPRTGAGAPWVTAAKLAVVVAIVGGGLALFLARTHATHESAGAPLVASTECAPMAAVPPPEVPAVVAAAPAPPASTVIAVRPATRAHEPRVVDGDRSVAAEVAILRRVSDALRAGDAKGALAGVDEHARRFPSGALAEERDMERIVALCALGRRSEAARATSQFSRAYPSSSHEARIREACAAPAASGTAP
jgi:rhodanese-related sulfurtransferase